MSARRFLLSLFTAAIILGAVVASYAQGTAYAPVQTKPQDMTIIGEGSVTEILKPDLVRLDNGALYVLDNTRVPPLYTEAALAWLDANLLNQPVTIYANAALPNKGRDRVGNRFGHAVLKNGDAWVQGKMVSGGLAWVDGTAANRDMILPLLALEETARTTRRGFWTARGMAPVTQETIGSARNMFAVVEGTATSFADKKDLFFVNFGENWKTDLTLRLTRDDVRLFPPGYRVANYVGQKLRVRGWVSERNGPNIDLTYPEQVEWLDTETPTKKAP